MTTRPNPTGLRIVEASALTFDGFSLLLLGDCGSKRVHACERDVDMPQISLDLHAHFEPTGDAVPLLGGLAATVKFSFLWGGQARTVVGVAGVLLRGSELILPRGTLAKLMDERATLVDHG